MVTDELKSKISPTDKTSPRPSKRLSAVDAKALVSSRKEEAKKILRRLIQHTAFANRKVEDELHKQIVQTRMSALTSVIKHHQKLSAPINAHTHNHSDSANSGLVLKTVINTTESSHKSESSQPTNLDYNKSDNWYDHIWSSLDPSSDRDCSNDDKEDEIINNIRSSIILRMQDLLGHSFTDPKTNDNKATTNAFDNNATSSEVPAEDCRAPLWQSMVGHCYDKLELDDKAIEYYAQSSFADVKEVMTLVAKKFLSVYPTLNLNDWKSNKSSVPLLSRAGIVFDRQDLLFLSSHNLLDPFLFGTAPNTMSNGSFVDSDTIDKSSRASNTSIFSPINESVQQYNTASDEPTNQKPILNISVFLKWAFSLGDLVGLQAYRLVTELIHQFLCHELATLLEVDVMCLQELDPSFQLGLHKSSSTFMNSGSLARLEAISVNNNANIGGTGNNVTSSSMRVPDSARQSLADINSSPSANTSQKQHSTTDGVLNSRIEYSELLSSLTPCELSTTLVIRVRELLRSSFIKTDRQSKVQVNDSLFTSVNVTTDLFSTLLSSSAFSEFEFETCKLQAVDLRNLSTNALTLFFCNIYNTLIVHGTIVYSVKGAPGSALYERNNFLKTFKYNIGGYLYSVLDVSYSFIYLFTIFFVLAYSL